MFRGRRGNVCANDFTTRSMIQSVDDVEFLLMIVICDFQRFRGAIELIERFVARKWSAENIIGCTWRRFGICEEKKTNYLS